jgi:hypothetical protein
MLSPTQEIISDPDGGGGGGGKAAVVVKLHETGAARETPSADLAVVDTVTVYVVSDFSELEGVYRMVLPDQLTLPETLGEIDRLDLTEVLFIETLKVTAMVVP